MIRAFAAQHFYPDISGSAFNDAQKKIIGSARLRVIRFVRLALASTLAQYPSISYIVQCHPWHPGSCGLHGQTNQIYDVDADSLWKVRMFSAFRELWLLVGGLTPRFQILQGPRACKPMQSFTASAKNLPTQKGHWHGFIETTVSSVQFTFPVVSQSEASQTLWRLCRQVLRC